MCPDARPHARSARRGGFAMILAIAVLAILSILGFAYVKYLLIDADETDWATERLHARLLAERGVHAAIAEIQAGLEGDSAVERGMTLELPIYAAGAANEAGARPPEVHDGVYGEVRIQLADESAKVNLNHAPVRLLQALLGVDGAAAREIRRRLPREGAPITEEQRYFMDLDELVTRGAVPEGAVPASTRDLFTVFTAIGPGPAEGYINLNSAPPQVLAAIANCSLEDAEAIAAARPFASYADFVAAAGGDPNTFNLSPPADAPDAMPAALTLEARCYRIRCEAALRRRGATDGGPALATAEAEAVVSFEDGAPRIVMWRDANLDARETDDAEAETEPTGDAAETEA